jgi:hypothetical protein
MRGAYTENGLLLDLEIEQQVTFTGTGAPFSRRLEQPLFRGGDGGLVEWPVRVERLGDANIGDLPSGRW